MDIKNKNIVDSPYFEFLRYWITSDDRLLLSIEARTYR